MCCHFEPVSHCIDQENSLAQYLDEWDKDSNLARQTSQTGGSWVEHTQVQVKPLGRSQPRTTPSLQYCPCPLPFAQETGPAKF